MSTWAHVVNLFCIIDTLATVGRSVYQMVDVSLIILHWDDSCLNSETTFDPQANKKKMTLKMNNGDLNLTKGKILH